MKWGVLATGWNCAEYFDRVLEPWLEYKEKHGNLIISAVSGHFKDFGTAANDNTKELMLHAFNTKKIEHLSLPVGYFEEADMRNLALIPLLKENVDYVFLLDFDEIYSLDQIEKILDFVQQNPFTVWFKIHFKNYVINEQHYVDDFCPPRIFKVEVNNAILANFYYDNDINYLTDAAKVSYKNLPSMTIPKNLAFVKHYSWCGSPERLQRKIEYQMKHFNGICSYKWNNQENKLELNLDFYKKYNVPVPTIHIENG